MGRRLIEELLRRNHRVRALVRRGSEQKLPAGCESILGNALNADSFANSVRPADTFVHLVGVSHPSPAKAEQFRAVDLASVKASIPSAVSAGVAHLVYISVAQPAPLMKAYIQVRAECEAMLRASGLNATIVRPWYVLGPGHRWPYLLIPAYWMLEQIPATKESARRLGLVTLPQMIATLVSAVENPCQGIRVVEVPDIRRGAVESGTLVTIGAPPRNT